MELVHLDDDYVEDKETGDTYVAVEGGCGGCAFDHLGLDNCRHIKCTPNMRRDGQTVQFIRTQK